jgi:hypothetical protein
MMSRWATPRGSRIRPRASSWHTRCRRSAECARNSRCRRSAECSRNSRCRRSAECARNSRCRRSAECARNSRCRRSAECARHGLEDGSVNGGVGPDGWRMDGGDVARWPCGWEVCWWAALWLRTCMRDSDLLHLRICFAMALARQTMMGRARVAPFSRCVDTTR